MKILHVINTLSPRSGGPALVLNELTRHQASAGHDVTIFTTNCDYPSGILKVPVNTPVIKADVRHYFFSVQFGPLLVSLPMASELIKTISSYDLLHIFGLYRFPTTFAAFLSRKRKIPYIIRPHGSLDPFVYQQSSRSVRVKRVYETFFDLPNLNAASAIHFITAEEQANCSFLGLRAPGIIIPNGLDWKRFEHLPTVGQMRHKLGLTDQLVVLFLGRIHFQKGLDLLIQSFSLVTKQIENAVLVIAGPDNDGYSKKVKSWIDSHGFSAKVFWLGMLYGQQVLDAYVDSDLFVLPSYSDNFGMAVVEAMACGLPVVISDQVKIWREVSQSGAGRAVKLDAKEISNAIIDIIGNRKVAQRMGEAGRNLVQNKYAYDNVIRSINKMYSSIINT